jgi:hypothetical protein
MRPLRSLDRQGQGLTIFFIALFAIPPAALLIGMMSQRSMWVGLLSWAPFWILVAVMDTPLRSLARIPRSMGWFCIGVTGAAFFMVGRGETFSLALAAGSGAVLASLELLKDFYRRKRDAQDG